MDKCAIEAAIIPLCGTCIIEEIFCGIEHGCSGWYEDNRYPKVGLELFEILFVVEEASLEDEVFVCLWVDAVDSYSYLCQSLGEVKLLEDVGEQLKIHYSPKGHHYQVLDVLTLILARLGPVVSGPALYELSYLRGMAVTETASQGKTELPHEVYLGVLLLCHLQILLRKTVTMSDAIRITGLNWSSF